MGRELVRRARFACHVPVPAPVRRCSARAKWPGFVDDFAKRAISGEAKTLLSDAELMCGGAHRLVPANHPQERTNGC